MAEEQEKIGAFVMLGGVPVDVLSGMLDVRVNPPPGFVSKHSFGKSDVPGRILRIDWFARCGQRPLTPDLTMPVRQVKDWSEAVATRASDSSRYARMEAQNQLTIYLSTHAMDQYRSWNKRVEEYDQRILKELLSNKIEPFRLKHQLPPKLKSNVDYDLNGALMEDSYLPVGHRVFFFLELFTVYEAGHFPCGWEGVWPQGTLLIY